jgi:flagellar biosynthesis protein
LSALRSRKVAAALSYPGAGTTPRVVAAGRGKLAERILELAREAGVPLREDAALAQALAELELGAEVPPLLYQAVAEALVWALRLDRKLASTAPRAGRIRVP